MRGAGLPAASAKERHQGESPTMRQIVRVSRHRFHGDPMRFPVMAEFLAGRFPEARYVADVAGGQGMLSRLLQKRHNIESEVIDPRGWTLRGVAGRQEEFVAESADFYDVVVGLHPDESLREVVRAATLRPVVVVPCCNFWSETEKLGRNALLHAIEEHHRGIGGPCDRVVLDFHGPYNQALVLTPPSGPR